MKIYLCSFYYIIKQIMLHTKMNSILPSGQIYKIVYNQNNVIGFLARRQCYVAVLPGHQYYEKDDDWLNSSDFPPVHGSVTWTHSYGTHPVLRDAIASIPELTPQHWVIGWDYNHFANMEQMMSGLSYGIKPTFELLKNECIDVCNEITRS
jgi:hypothetical protein